MHYVKRFIFILFIVAIGVISWVTYQKITHFSTQPLMSNDELFFEVPRGTTAKSLGKLLEDKKILADASLLPWYLKLHPEFTHLKSGFFSLKGVKNVNELLRLLNEGKEMQFHARFVQGTTFKEWRQILDNLPYIKHTLKDKTDAQIYALLDLPTNTGNTNLDGWLFPDTYSYAPNSTDLDLLKRASIRLQKTLAQAWENRAENLPLKTPYDLLILASIIQKETSLVAEEPMVAAVFINRLNKKIRLQTDPTVIYGMGDKYQGNIRKRDLVTPTPYNTYTIDGLPPTPIAMVNKSVLEAAAHPAVTDVLFFVADGTGGHKFSKTLNEHNQAVHAYMQWYRQHIQGKK